VTTGLLLSDGLLLIINPEFTALRWPWELNSLDARIMAAWFVGWAVWLGAMAYARDWIEIRLPSLLFVLNGVALVAVNLAFGGEFRPGGTAGAYQWGIAALTVVTAFFVAVQELRRRRSGA
jgi:hypothetical protein